MISVLTTVFEDLLSGEQVDVLSTVFKDLLRGEKSISLATRTILSTDPSLTGTTDW